MKSLNTIIKARAAAQVRADRLREHVAIIIEELGDVTITHQFIDELVKAEAKLAKLNEEFDIAAEAYRNGR